jgi:hypothetical protein
MSPPANEETSVPAKKSQRSADGVQYLLSGDRKFRRLSLKKISERVKKARRKTKGAAVSKAAAASGSESNVTHHSVASNGTAIAFGLISLVLLAALVVMWWPTPSAADEQAAEAESHSAAVLTADVASAPAMAVKKVASPARDQVPDRATSSAKARPAETTVARAETAPIQPLVSSQNAHPAAAGAPIDTVTISGCLEYDGKSAWLKNASGAEAPRARSWRSGFLTKRSPRIALVDGPGSVTAYDGRRVTVTGVLVDREMRVNSLRPLAGDCD